MTGVTLCALCMCVNDIKSDSGAVLVASSPWACTQISVKPSWLTLPLIGLWVYKRICKKATLYHLPNICIIESSTPTIVAVVAAPTYMKAMSSIVVCRDSQLAQNVPDAADEPGIGCDYLLGIHKESPWVGAPDF